MYCDRCFVFKILSNGFTIFLSLAMDLINILPLNVIAYSISSSGGNTIQEEMVEECFQAGDGIASSN